MFTEIQFKPQKRDLKFPGLNLEDLNEEEKEELKFTLTAETRNIVKRFSAIPTDFCYFLMDQPKLQIKVLLKLKALSSIPSIYKKDDVLHVVSEETIFVISNILENHCSFFNYDLLEDIFTLLNYQEGLEALRQHEEKLTEYAARRITHFPSGVGIQNSENYVIVAVKLDDIYDGCRIFHLINFHRKLSQLLKVCLSEFVLDGLKGGCILVEFHLLENMVETIFPLSKKMRVKLLELNCCTAKITEISCGKYYCKLKSTGGKYPNGV